MTSATANPSGRRLLGRAERRAAILRAAARAFAQRGFAGTSMEEVAAAAGITKLIVYRHFASKEALYDGVLEQVSTRLAEAFVSLLEREPPPRLGIKAMLTVAREEPDGFVLLWRHAEREPTFAEHALRIRRQAVQVAEAMPAIAGMADPARRRWAASLLVSWLVDAVLHWLEEGTADRDDELVELVARSIPPMVRAWANVPAC
ncbi:MAG TPA: TetR/AcrR family transcriptional regulator [Acidimicrobiales bacterium]|nr:TetR/AcrR family transcriptional regulator [Acidimicrobiales bacterium]